MRESLGSLLWSWLEVLVVPGWGKDSIYLDSSSVLLLHVFITAAIYHCSGISVTGVTCSDEQSKE